MGSHHGCGYLCQHSYFSALHANLATALHSGRKHSPTTHPAKPDESSSSVLCLNPDNLRRKISWWVSCYAFFKWWLLLSQHPHCQRNLTSLSVLSIDLGTLDWDLGCFPFDQRTLAPVVLLPINNHWYSEFDRTDEIAPYSVLPVLYPQWVR